MPACWASHDCFSQCPWPLSMSLSKHTSTGHSWTLTHICPSLLWGHCSFLLGLGTYTFFFGAKSLFPQSCGSSVITSHWPSTSNSLGTLSLLSGSPGWESCCRSLNFCNSARNSLVSLFSSLWVIWSVALWWGWWRPPPRELMPRSQLPLYWNI